MATTQTKPLVRVIETRAVDYEQHSWLFFKWDVRVSEKKMRNDIFIETNDDFDSVFINGTEYKVTPSH